MPITIHNEAERLAHPQARLVPKQFLTMNKGMLSDAQLRFMTTPEEGLEALIDVAVYPSFSFNEGHRGADCLALVIWGHPDISVAKIVSLVTYWGLALSDVIQVAVMAKRLDVLDDLVAREGLDKVMDEFSIAPTVFALSASFGRVEVLDWLAAKASLAQLAEMIAADDYNAFAMAAFSGQLEALNWLAGKVSPAQSIEMMAAENYRAFSGAAAGGNPGVLDWFVAQVSAGQLAEMIAAEGYGAFTAAAVYGQLDALRWLVDKAPGKLPEMIAYKNFSAFTEAAAQGRVEVLQWLADQAPTLLSSMIEADDFRAFTRAAANGHLEVLQWLAAKDPERIPLMIGGGSYAGASGSVERAVADRRLDVIKWLIAHVDPEQLPSIMIVDRCGAFALAVREADAELINTLLNNAILFGHAEEHEAEYSALTHPFITAKLEALRDRRQAFEMSHPQRVFDLSAEETPLYFQIMRNLIRRNDPALLDDLRFLLETPALKDLAHEDVERSASTNSNELLCLALRVENRGAAEILMTIPAVRLVAEGHHYYRAELRGELNLEEVARDRESSMRSLSQGEQTRLSGVIERYQPVLQAGGEPLFEHFLDDLRARYKAHPAKIKVGEEELDLPVDWASFAALDLSPAQRKAACEAYYQHSDHSALRYLSKPNQWMAANASYVYINDAHTERWATFEDYKPLILMMWLAASDATVMPVDGYSLEDRVTHFFHELALIGRAHNWDKTRVKLDAAGATVLDARGRPVMEEYDDGQGDKPSCYSGVKRRLFQSVQGYPGLKLLSADDIKYELRDFIRTNLQTKIRADANPQELRAAWDACVLGEDAAALARLNLSDEEQRNFSAYLSAKYGPSWKDDQQLKKIVDNAFKVEHSSDRIHAIKFAGLIQFESLLPAAPVVVSGAGAFESKDEDEGHTASPGFGR